MTEQIYESFAVIFWHILTDSQKCDTRKKKKYCEK